MHTYWAAPLLAACLFVSTSHGLNYTGETALLDAAPALPNRRHATSVTFGELGAFDFRGDGRARVALQLGAFSSEKDTTTAAVAAAAASTTGGASGALLGGPKAAAGDQQQQQQQQAAHRGGAVEAGGMFDTTAAATNDSRPTRDTDPIELDHVYLIFAKARAVNNFVARLHTLRKSDETAAIALCTNVSSWLDSEFVAPITSLHRPAPVKKDEDGEPDDDDDAKKTATLVSSLSSSGAVESLNESGQSDSSSSSEGRLKISFISASGPTAPADLSPRPTKVTGIQKRQLVSTRIGDQVTDIAVDEELDDDDASSGSSAEPSSAQSPSDTPLLGTEPNANDVFLVEYEWEWVVEHGGEYAVVIANCAATTIQFKYNLIMANRWQDGTWTNLPAGWMPVQQVYPAVCYTLWGLSILGWITMQVRLKNQTKPILGVILGFVPFLRFMSCLADQSRYNLWGNGSYEVTMIVVSTSLVDSLADGAHFLVLLALCKGWGVVRARLTGSEKRLLSGLVIFIGVATLYDGATRGGGVLAVGVMQIVALLYAWANFSHVRRIHSVQILRLVSRNESTLLNWYRCSGSSEPVDDRGSQTQLTYPATPQHTMVLSPTLQALKRLSAIPWAKVQSDLADATNTTTETMTMGLLWSAVRKDRLLRMATYIVLPLQTVDLITLFVSSFAVPSHYAFVGLLLIQVSHWIAFVAVFVCLLIGGQDVPEVSLPALPAVTTRRCIPVPPDNFAQISPRPLPPLGKLRLFRSAALFASPSVNNAAGEPDVSNGGGTLRQRNSRRI